MKKLLLTIFITFYSSIIIAQDFRASLKSEKLNNESEWTEWSYSGALIRIKDENVINVDDGQTKVNYKVLKFENESSYDGEICNVMSFICESPTNERIEIKFIDKQLNFMEDRKNSKYKLDRFRIYIHKNNKRIRYNVYLLQFGNPFK